MKNKELHEVTFLEQVVIGLPARLTCEEYPGQIMTTSPVQAFSTTNRGYKLETKHTVYDIRLKLAKFSFENVTKPVVMLGAPLEFQAEGKRYVTDEVVSVIQIQNSIMVFTRTARYELYYAL